MVPQVATAGLPPKLLCIYQTGLYNDPASRTTLADGLSRWLARATALGGTHNPAAITELPAWGETALAAGLADDVQQVTAAIAELRQVIPGTRSAL